MNISKMKNNPKYVCDKCREEIIGYHKNSKRHIVPNKYYKAEEKNIKLNFSFLLDFTKLNMNIYEKDSSYFRWLRNQGRF